MVQLSKKRRLKKELGLFDVFAVATGTTLSAGFFLLPGLAAEQVGPALVLAYLLAVAVSLAVALGRWGAVAVSVGALLAFTSVANAGTLSASRYPLAMSRDRLLPRFFRRLTRGKTPAAAIVSTTLAIVLMLVLLDPTKIAKLASAFQLLMFALVCLAVIVMKESRIESYDPGYRSPLYPWMQIVGIVTPLLLIAEMGALTIAVSAAFVAAPRTSWRAGSAPGTSRC